MDLNTLLKRHADDLLRPGSKPFLLAQQLLASPLEVIHCPYLVDDHPLKTQAWTVWDAFESVTNGMENPQALCQLVNLPEPTVFSPWKPFILALHAFYREQDEECLALLRRVPTDTPLGRLARDLESDLRSVQELAQGRQRPLRLKELWWVPHTLAETLDQLENTAFPETEAFFLDALVEAGMVWASRSVREQSMFSHWALGLCLDRGLDEALALRRLMGTPLERSAVERGAAAAFLKTAPETALLLFGHSLLDSSFGPGEVHLLEHLYRAVREWQNREGADPEFEREWAHLERRLTELGIRVEARTALAQRRKGWDRSPIQLELFAS